MTKKRIWMLGALFGCTLIALAVFKVRDRLNAPGDVPLLKIKTSHKFGVKRLSFSRDGNFLVSHSYESVNVWDAKSGAVLPLSTSFVTKARSGSASSPDATLLAVENPGAFVGKKTIPSVLNAPNATYSVYRDQGIDLHALENGRLIRTLRVAGDTTGLRYQIDDVEFSPDKKRVSAKTFGKAGFSIIVWDLESGRVLAKRSVSYNSPQTGRVSLLSSSQTAFTANGRFLVAAMALRDDNQVRNLAQNPNPNSKVQLFDLLTWRPLMILDGVVSGQFNSPPVLRVSFSPNGRLVALIRNSISGGISLSDKVDGTVYVCSLQTRQLLWKTRTQNVFPSIATFSPDSKMLAIGAMKFGRSAVITKGDLQLRDAQTGALRERFSEETGADKWKQKWQQQQLRARYAVPIKGVVPTERNFASGDSGYVMSLAWSPDSTRLAAGYNDLSIKIWKAR